MPGRPIVVAAVLAAALCPLRAHALGASASASQCGQTVGGDRPGLEAIRDACPGIDQAMKRLRLGNLLPADWDKRASPEMLRDLDALTRQYAGRPSSTLPPASDLRAIALRLRLPDAPPASFRTWERFKGWLRQFLPLSALRRWLQSLPAGDAGPNPRTMLLVGLGALILLGLAAAIYSREWIEALFGKSRRLRSGRRKSTRPRIETNLADRDDEVAGAQALERPASALRMLIQALRRSRRIERDGNLTCHEVLARALFDTERQREGFARIALLAEWELFGPHDVPVRVPDELRPALQALYTDLLAAPAARSAIS